VALRTQRIHPRPLSALSASLRFKTPIENGITTHAWSTPKPLNPTWREALNIGPRGT
jgi:hypothetical protein